MLGLKNSINSINFLDSKFIDLNRNTFMITETELRLIARADNMTKVKSPKMDTKFQLS